MGKSTWLLIAFVYAVLGGAVLGGYLLIDRQTNGVLDSTISDGGNWLELSNSHIAAIEKVTEFPVLAMNNFECESFANVGNCIEGKFELDNYDNYVVLSVPNNYFLPGLTIDGFPVAQSNARSRLSDAFTETTIMELSMATNSMGEIYVERMGVTLVDFENAIIEE